MKQNKWHNVSLRGHWPNSFIVCFSWNLFIVILDTFHWAEINVTMIDNNDPTDFIRNKNCSNANVLWFYKSRHWCDYHQLKFDFTKSCQAKVIVVLLIWLGISLICSHSFCSLILSKLLRSTETVDQAFCWCATSFRGLESEPPSIIADFA